MQNTKTKKELGSIVIGIHMAGAISSLHIKIPVEGFMECLPAIELPFHIGFDLGLVCLSKLWLILKILWFSVVMQEVYAQ